ncbi:MAG TPA: hypothetical protein VHE78_13965 [Gemmatimonadaceae bacterium]|nr:hypothetical protein [Gemmatimonadaceae bacterium]
MPASHSARLRAAILAALFLVAVVASCRDQPLVPRGKTLRPPATATFDISSETENDPVSDATNAIGSVNMTTFFPTNTMVDITFSGMITRHPNFPGEGDVQFGPAGMAGSCGGQMRIDYDSGATWWPGGGGCTTEEAAQSSWTFTQGVKGTARVSRSAAPSTCAGQASPC